MRCLGGGLLLEVAVYVRCVWISAAWNVRDQVVAILRLLQATEGHLGAGNVLLRVLEVGEQSLLLPGDAFRPVGICVREALDRASLATKETVEVGANLVGATSLKGMALSAAGLKSKVNIYSLRPCTMSRLTLKRPAPFLASPVT